MIVHPVPPPAAGPIRTAFSAACRANAQRLAVGLAAVGAEPIIVEAEPGGAPFGRRLREARRDAPTAGLVVLGSGSLPLARRADLRRFVQAAGTPGGPILCNNRYSADVLALPPSVVLDDLPDAMGDNALPRWLSDRGRVVEDRRTAWRLGVDLDSPIDAIACGLPVPGLPRERVDAALASVRAIAGDPSAELVVAGRSSAASLRWLEGGTRCRTRVLVEERGFRTGRVGQRPPRSSLGLLLDRDGPSALGGILGELGDAAIVDSRVLLAHHFGRDESAWPGPDDRFASDLLLPEAIADPWLQALTHSVAATGVPVLLGGHTLVGPGLRLVLGTPR